MTNQLANETSPYLLQHAHQPVHWQPWGEKALRQAVLEDKPIFLSIGYSACHWCHVMAHESFDDPRTADLLNQYFISVKLDREERPDLDHIYMTAVVAMTGQGGWPLSVFLTPDGRPFFGGTYFPPEPRYNMPAFTDLLIAIARMWQENRIEFLKTADEVFNHLKETISNTDHSYTKINSTYLKQAEKNLLDRYDWKFGGWGTAPKFPAPMSIDFLLGQAERGSTSSRQAAFHALHAMQRGGMYDVINGGFHRYSTDAQWLVPHFEKMLYDNAQLARSYLHAYQQSGDLSFKSTAEETLEFLLRELRHPDGGFYSSLDADSEGEEGKYYLWSYPELQQYLSSPELEILAAHYPLSEGGNFEGFIILQQPANSSQPVMSTNDNPTAVLHEVTAKLFLARSQKIRPATDDKILTFWNALTISALAEAGRILDRADYRAAAYECANFIHNNLIIDEQLHRSWRAGSARHAAGLEDYASFGLAMLSLYQMDLNPIWFQRAVWCLNIILRDFKDPQGGFFSVPGSQRDVIVRMKEIHDQAVPSGNALAVFLLVKLSYLMQREDYLQEALRAVSTVQDNMLAYPNAFALWLQAVDWMVNPVDQIVVTWDSEETPLDIILATANETCQLSTIFAGSSSSERKDQPPMAQNQPVKFQPVTFYRCVGPVCSAPAATLAETRKTP